MIGIVVYVDPSHVWWLHLTELAPRAGNVQQTLDTHKNQSKDLRKFKRIWARRNEVEPSFFRRVSTLLNLQQLKCRSFKKKENASVTVRQPWNVAVISNHRSRKSNRPWKNELWLHRSVWLSHYTVLFTFCFKRRRKQNVNQRFGSWNREAQLGLISMLIAVNWMQTSSWSIELAGIVLNAQFNRSFLKTETAILSEIWRFIKFIHFAF